MGLREYLQILSNGVVTAKNAIKVRYVGIRANLLQLSILACAVNLITFVRISSGSPVSLRY